MIERLFNFLKMLHMFERVERAVYPVGSKKQENDAEHSYQLAMFAWYLIDTECLPLDREKVFKYALCHDLVEVYAGDVQFYRSQEEEEGKKKRERNAQLRLTAQYPEFTELHGFIEQYERQEDDESQFVYALDKILPAMSVYLDGGRKWKELGITFEQLEESKNRKVQSPHVRPFWEELRSILSKNRHMFHDKQ